MNPYVFVVGCPRSGTTLLQRLLDAHPQLAVINETRWIAGWFKRRLGLTPEGHVTHDLLERLPGHPTFERLGIDPHTLAGLLPRDEPVHYADFVTSLFDVYGERRGTRLVGDKCPRYVRNVPTLHGLWPRTRFVHLIRDGRDVCLSVLEWRKGARNFSSWKADPISTTGLWWEWHVRLGQDAAALLGADQYYELRYESLVADPERECRGLCAFLGLRFNAAMLRFHEGRTRKDPELDAKKAWRPVTPGLRTWKAQMPSGDLVRFEAVAGALLAELGYERAAPSPPRDAVVWATQLREAFERDLRERRATVPEAWLSVTR